MHPIREVAYCLFLVVVSMWTIPPFYTRLCNAKCSAVYYTLCRHFCKNAIAALAGNDIWSSRKSGLWLHGLDPLMLGWFHHQTWRIWNPAIPNLTLRFVKNILKIWPYSRKISGQKTTVKAKTNELIIRLGHRTQSIWMDGQGVKFLNMLSCFSFD